MNNRLEIKPGIQIHPLSLEAFQAYFKQSKACVLYAIDCLEFGQKFSTTVSLAYLEYCSLLQSKK